MDLRQCKYGYGSATHSSRKAAAAKVKADGQKTRMMMVARQIQKGKVAPEMATPRYTSHPDAVTDVVKDLKSVRYRHKNELAELVADCEEDAAKEVEEANEVAEAEIAEQVEKDRKELHKVCRKELDTTDELAWKLQLHQGTNSKKLQVRQRKDMLALKVRIKDSMNHLLAKHRDQTAKAVEEMTRQHRTERRDITADHGDDICVVCKRSAAAGGDDDDEAKKKEPEVCGGCELAICGECAPDCDACMECDVRYCKECAETMKRCNTCKESDILHCCGKQAVMPCGALEFGECAKYHKDICDCHKS